MDTKNANDLMAQYLKTVPTNLEGVQGIEPPPPGFDPLTADRGQLLRHGFPLPPDAARSPEAVRIWRNTLGRRMRHIVPELRRRPEIKERTRFERGDAGLTSSNWSGGVALSGGPFTFVSGAWIVPAVVPPVSGDGDWWSVAWVGIDGDGSSDVLQAGTGQHVRRHNGVVTTEYFAWYEWYPYSWTEITNLAVSPGDAMSVTVRYLGVSNGVGQGTATVMNLTTGQSATVSLTAPAGTVLKGNCVEWIMERPGINGALASLPEYEHITFYNTLACSSNAIISGNQAQSITMTGTGGKTLSTGTLATSDWDCGFIAAN